MNFKDFEVTDREIEEGSPEYFTTHPLISFDSNSETYWVNLGEGAFCEVYGRNRAKRAFDIAETCFVEGEPLDE